MSALMRSRIRHTLKNGGSGGYHEDYRSGDRSALAGFKGLAYTERRPSREQMKVQGRLLPDRNDALCPLPFLRWFSCLRVAAAGQGTGCLCSERAADCDSAADPVARHVPVDRNPGDTASSDRVARGVAFAGGDAQWLVILPGTAAIRGRMVAGDTTTQRHPGS